MILSALFLVGSSAFATQPIRDWGYEAGRGKVDFNGDGHIDLCRVIGTAYPNSYVLCSLSTGDSVEQLYAGQDVLSASIDWGYEAGRAWPDFNGDGKADYCRIRGVPGNYVATCLLSTGNGFGTEVNSPALDPGYEDTRIWRDVNNDGKADYCRIVGNNREIVRCTLSTGGAFGQEIDDLAR
jgi:hypothetical protein